MLPRSDFASAEIAQLWRSFTHRLVASLIIIELAGVSVSQLPSSTSIECPTARLEIFWFYRISEYESGRNPPGSLTLDWCIEAKNCSVSSDCNFYEYREQRSPRANLHGFLNFHLDLPLAVDYVIKLTFKDHALWSQPVVAELQLPEQDERNLSTVIREYALSENTPNRILRIRAQRQCPPNHYGLHCTRICVPRNGVYRCGSKGERICEPGFSGENCLENDVCHPNPCVKEAQCIALPQSRIPICICNNGTSNADCYKKTNPCQPSPCQNGGQCEVDEWQMATCRCTEMWTGKNCQVRRLACEEVRQRLWSQSSSPGGNASTIDVCLNGGQCFENMFALEWSCVCPEGWTGQRCETPTAFVEKIITAVLGVVSLILIVMVILLLIRLFKLKRKEHNAKGESLALPDESSQIDEADTLHSKPIHRPPRSKQMHSLQSARNEGYLTVDSKRYKPPNSAKPDAHVYRTLPQFSPALPPKSPPRPMNESDIDAQPIRPKRPICRRDPI